MKRYSNVKDEIASLKREDQKRANKLKEKQRKNKKWIIQIFIMAFFISVMFSFVSETFIPKLSLVFGILLIVVFIALGIVFDMIGVAVTASDEKPFHSMSARKVRGAKVAVLLKKNADKVGSFCNDVIGDICGVVSGSAGAIIASSIANQTSLSPFLLSLIVTGLIAAFTIGGKAIGKSVAINQCNMILYEAAKVISYFYHPKK